MKRMLPLLIGALLAIAAAYFLLKKKNAEVVPPVSSPPDGGSANGVPDRISTIKKMEKYIDEIYQKGKINITDWDANVATYNKKAKEWAKGMYTWCLEEQNGWSFDSQQEQADKNGYSLPLQMVQSIAWQLYGSAGLYSSAVWDEIADVIFDIAAKEAK